MEPKLLTFTECYNNIKLFSEYSFDESSDKPLSFSGRFFCVDTKLDRTGPSIRYFMWIYDNMYHRIDGPAIMKVNSTKFWYFMNERVLVKNQDEFDEWVVQKISEI